MMGFSIRKEAEKKWRFRCVAMPRELPVAGLVLVVGDDSVLMLPGVGPVGSVVGREFARL